LMGMPLKSSLGEKVGRSPSFPFPRPIEDPWSIASLSPPPHRYPRSRTPFPLLSRWWGKNRWRRSVFPLFFLFFTWAGRERRGAFFFFSSVVEGWFWAPVLSLFLVSRTASGQIVVVLSSPSRRRSISFPPNQVLWFCSLLPFSLFVSKTSTAKGTWSKGRFSFF